MKLKIAKDFTFCHKGYERRDYVEGEVVEADDEELIAVATREGWAVDADAPPPENKGKGGAPENKGSK